MNIKSLLVDMLLQKEKIALSPMIAGFVSTAAEQMIREKLQADVKIRLSELNIFNQNGNAHFHLNAESDMNENELRKLLVKADIPLLGAVNVPEREDGDEINITSKLLTEAFSVVLGRFVSKKLGIDVSIWLNGFSFVNRDGNALFRIDADGDANSRDILKLIG